MDNLIKIISDPKLGLAIIHLDSNLNVLDSTQQAATLLSAGTIEPHTNLRQLLLGFADSESVNALMSVLKAKSNSSSTIGSIQKKVKQLQLSWTKCENGNLALLLKDRTEQFDLEHKLMQAENWQKTMNMFVGQVLKAHSTQEVLWDVIDFCVECLELEDCVIFLLNDEKNLLLEQASYKKKVAGKREIAGALDLELDKGVCGYVTSTGKPKIIGDTAKDDRYVVQFTDMRSEICVPIIADNEVIGVIDSEHSQENFFNLKHLSFLNTLANLVANRIKTTLTEDRMRDNQERLALVLKGGDLGFWDWDIKTGQITYNDRWAEMLGYNLAEVESSIVSWDKIMHPEDKPEIMRRLNDHLEGRTEFYESEHRLKTADDKWLYVLDRGKVVEHNAEGNPCRMAGTHLEVHEKKKAQTNLLNLTQELQISNKELKQFAYITSHNLRAPVVNLHSLDELFDTSELSAHNNLIYEKISSSIGRLQDTLNDLIEVVALKNKTLVSLGKINLPRLIDKVLGSVERQLAEVGADIELNHGIKTLVHSPSVLESTILNLVTNAVKYRKPEIPLKLTITTKLQNGEPILTVKDNGLGINLEMAKDKLFAMYGRLNTQVEGKGLGLYMIKSQLESLGGDIAVTSELGQGCCFTVYLHTSNNDF